ncbi:hypothetical protein [Nocardia arizonensis]|uniref:hypothetical protein n=1 Tax=Nocardia arizonensis TaxID=1141647 RepID=UPI0012E7097E|nr:hypothetical protein [Nocardia arizonensis]
MGSRHVVIELDRGFLPIHVEFDTGWKRYVQPYEVGSELMRAYEGAVSRRMDALFATDRVPSPWEVSDTAVPDLHTVLAVLLETTSWEQFTTVSSRIVAGEDYEVHGTTVFRGVPAVTVRANRDYLTAITVQPSWTQSIDPHRVADELLRCAGEVRDLRPNFTVSGDYSRFSEADLEFRLDRHRQRLLEERA